MTAIAVPTGASLARNAEAWLDENGDKHWTGYVDGVTWDLAQAQSLTGVNPALGALTSPSP
jgi:hypothetical protein